LQGIEEEMGRNLTDFNGYGQSFLKFLTSKGRFWPHLWLSLRVAPTAHTSGAPNRRKKESDRMGSLSPLLLFLPEPSKSQDTLSSSYFSSL
jgi:hypothetical protein